MKTIHDLSQLHWTLAGYTPHSWRFAQTMEIGIAPTPEVASLPARVPGSVQNALRAAGLVPDWNVALNSRACEWIENRHWIFSADLPDQWFSARRRTQRLRCDGLDGNGFVLLNNAIIGEFKNAFVPHQFDLASQLKPSGNQLQIVFECAPRWLGQVGFTSQMTEFKPRFNYTWDWIPRLVQIGIWDAMHIESGDGIELGDVRVSTDVDEGGRGVLQIRAQTAGEFGDRHAIHIELRDRDGSLVETNSYAPSQLKSGVTWRNLKIELWQPNARGTSTLYDVKIQLLEDGIVLDETAQQVGFKRIEWRTCQGAPENSDPWICVINGAPLFLQGANWTPILPNFADVSDEEYRRRIALYRDLGFNLLRVWGGAFLEKEIFYKLCDEMGILVWQEFPLSSSGLDNWPPEDEYFIDEMERVAKSYIARRAHHASFLMWCGGNELQGDLKGNKTGVGKPIDNSHPLMNRLQRIVTKEDATHRFVPSSSSGPRFMAEEKEFGQGLHWDVHGPWDIVSTFEDWQRYWENDDALFRSETGCPGASGADIIEAFAGELPSIPGTLDNPLWRRTSWWIDWPRFVEQRGREPRDLEEYTRWSQERQERALSIAARETKKRFPACGGLIVWMGADCFPCTSNTSIIDFWGRPKPAARGLAEVFHAVVDELT